jgi:hypothetical protein
MRGCISEPDESVLRLIVVPRMIHARLVQKKIKAIAAIRLNMSAISQRK